MSGKTPVDHRSLLARLVFDVLLDDAVRPRHLSAQIRSDHRRRVQKGATYLGLIGYVPHAPLYLDGGD